MNNNIKLYTGDEAFRLFKQMYYKYCNYSIEQLKNYIKVQCSNTNYNFANDYIGIQIKTMSILVYMKQNYNNKTDKWDNDFWFQVFIKRDIFNKNILERNGITN